MNLENVVKWCEENQAIVTFHKVHRHPRVIVRIGGLAGRNYAKRDTITEAVEFLSSK